MACAYMITCPTGKSYVGVTSNLTHRLREHKSKSRPPVNCLLCKKAVPVHVLKRHFAAFSAKGGAN